MKAKILMQSNSSRNRGFKACPHPNKYHETSDNISDSCQYLNLYIYELPSEKEYI